MRLCFGTVVYPVLGFGGAVPPRRRDPWRVDIFTGLNHRTDPDSSIDHPFRYSTFYTYVPTNVYVVKI